MHTGSCLCGAVRFEVAGELAGIQLCCCGQCRKAQGSAFGANIPVASADFRLLSGEGELREYRASPGKRRVFCGRCGSPVFSQRDETPEAIRLRAGLLDSPVDARPAFWFHTDSQADWWPPAPDLPRHPREAPG
ncbi:MAG: GFA family protein [Phenylobacterium sp.]|uniref:GFA family protein n=1 Tax=Phenylobacterium sp. TaxID=1871053 RepID=UPI00355E5443